MEPSERERISHVFRRLGPGSHPGLAATAGDTDEAIHRALDLSGSAPEPPDLPAPATAEEAYDPAGAAEPIRWWIGSMTTSERILVERLTWFWHHHFATGLAKVRIPYLLWRQHLRLRSLATGSFRDLLAAVATDPAMLLYLDGIHNTADRVNENYAREVMELHTLGPGAYTQGDVAEVARACTGWVIHLPFVSRAVAAAGDTPEWEPFLVASRHDDGVKRILGREGRFDLDDTVEILLEHPATARHVASRLFTHLVGHPPDPETAEALAAGWSDDYQVTELVERIVAHPDFLAERAVRAKVRTPLERLVAILQAFGDGTVPEAAGLTLHRLDYLPFNPPNPAGFPDGDVLLGPFQLVHAVDLLGGLDQPPPAPPGETLAALGLFDVSDATLATLEGADPALRTALAVTSPEFALV